MALSRSKGGFFGWAVALSALAASSGCSEKDGPAVGASGVYGSAPSAGGAWAAYWVVDRVEEGAVGGEGVAVLEDPETLRTEERPVKSLPAGVGEGLALTGGVAPRIDLEETAARAARIAARFERLKAD